MRLRKYENIEDRDDDDKHEDNYEDKDEDKKNYMPMTTTTKAKTKQKY